MNRTPMAYIETPTQDHFLYVNLERDENGMLGFKFAKDDSLQNNMFHDAQIEQESNEVFFYVDWYQAKEWVGGQIDLGKYVLD